MGKYEVTQGQWKKIMGNNPSYFQNCGENCPVEKVSWNDVQDFIKKLCDMEKMNPCKYRLPTEAEWEYSARAGSTTELYNGKLEINAIFQSKNLEQIGWYAGNAKATYTGGYSIRGLSKIFKFFNYTHQFLGTQIVGKKKPNAWGLYDMIGNVWEWIEDYFDDKYYDKSKLVDPKGSTVETGDYRALRGGCWFVSPQGCRISIRNSGNPDYINNCFGFRLVLLP
jgi:formylglycine-generating enzyme required for sulfatase activity